MHTKNLNFLHLDCDHPQAKVTLIDDESEKEQALIFVVQTAENQINCKIDLSVEVGSWQEYLDHVLHEVFLINVGLIYNGMPFNIRAISEADKVIRILVTKEFTLQEQIQIVTHRLASHAPNLFSTN